jgi:hypothetical protein
LMSDFKMASRYSANTAVGQYIDSLLANADKGTIDMRWFGEMVAEYAARREAQIFADILKGRLDSLYRDVMERGVFGGG